MVDNIDTSVSLCGIKLDNPVIPSSGTFGYGYEFADLYDINQLGTFSFKGTTADKRYGNETPRIAEGMNGIINSVGLQNPGVNEVITKELPKLFNVFHKPVMANVSGFSIEEYVRVCEKLSEIEQIGWLEVNISCPNVHGGGMSFGTNPKSAASVVSAVRKCTSKPIIIKLSPNVTSISEIAKAVESEGADAVSLVNTFMAMRIDINKKKPILANTTGGYSGAAIFPIALRMVYDVYQNVKIPIVGMGGVSSAEDVVEMMMAGATAVEVGAANLIDPYASLYIIKNLPKVMKKIRVNKLSDIVGIAGN